MGRGLIGGVLLCTLGIGGDEGTPLPPVGEDLASLQAAFAAADGVARVVVVVSERNATVRGAMRAVRTEVLPAISSPDLAVLVVWVPERDSDTEPKARAEAAKVAEPRLKPFWAGDPTALDRWRASLAKGAAIDPKGMPRAGLFAVYSPTSRWGGVPPAPVFWTHLDRKLAKSHPPLDLAALRAAITEHIVPEPEELAAMPTEARAAREDPNRRYFLHGPTGGGPAPKKGRPLLVVLPGGKGSADFRTFVKLIGKNSGGEEWLVAQLIAKRWTEKQEVIWPTERLAVTGQQFPTEEFIDSVIEDAARVREVDRERIVVLAWSSGGPAIYAHALRPNAPIPVRRYFVSQSVFHREGLPPLEGAKGKRFYLHHSRTDPKCKFSDAEAARDSLRAAGATVELVEYEGGHGWHGDMYDQIRKGIAWLLE